MYLYLPIRRTPPTRQGALENSSSELYACILYFLQSYSHKVNKITCGAVCVSACNALPLHCYAVCLHWLDLAAPGAPKDLLAWRADADTRPSQKGRIEQILQHTRSQIRFCAAKLDSRVAKYEPCATKCDPCAAKYHLLQPNTTPV